MFVVFYRRLGIDLRTTRNTAKDHYMETWRHPLQNRKYITYRNAARLGPSHVQATCSEIGEVRPCGFWDMQTDRQTVTLSMTILLTHPRGEVTVNDVPLHCVWKMSQFFACCSPSFIIRERVLIIFGRNINEKVSNQKVPNFPASLLRLCSVKLWNVTPCRPRARI